MFKKNCSKINDSRMLKCNAPKRKALLTINIRNKSIKIHGVLTAKIFKSLYNTHHEQVVILCIHIWQMFDRIIQEKKVWLSVYITTERNTHYTNRISVYKVH